MFSTSFLASADSASDSKEPGCEPSPSARSTHSAAESSQSIGLACRSMTTSAPSTERNATLFPLDTLASPNRLPGSVWAQQTTAGSGRRLSESSRIGGPLGFLVRMLLDTPLWASTKCYLTWKVSATPGKRSFFRLAPSMPRTAGTASGLLPTPAATDYKSESMSLGLVVKRAAASNRGVRLTEYLHRRMLPTPNAGNDHWGARLDEWGGSSNPFRGTEIGRLRLNPSWTEELMGYPIGWTDVGPSETPSSRKSLKSSGGRSSKRKG